MYQFLLWFLANGLKVFHKKYTTFRNYLSYSDFLFVIRSDQRSVPAHYEFNECARCSAFPRTVHLVVFSSFTACGFVSFILLLARPGSSSAMPRWHCHFRHHELKRYRFYVSKLAESYSAYYALIWPHHIIRSLPRKTIKIFS